MSYAVKSITFQKGVDRLIQELRLPHEHSREVILEGEKLPREISSREREGRADLTHEKVFTIDGETARDFDDAVSITAGSQGGYRLKVSIADVSHYVLSDSLLDREALLRGTSAYFPDRCLPMLPERLSNDLCSLVPQKPRLTVTAEIDFDRQGEKIGSRLYKSVIQSAARLTYTEVKKILVDRDAGLIRRYGEIVPDLKVMAELAERIREKRTKRGSLDFDLPEPEIVLDLEEGGVEEIVQAERNLAHRLIEEFMIAANESVAEWLTEKDIPLIYRIHEGPDPKKAGDFQLFLHNRGVSVHFRKRVTQTDFVQILERIRTRSDAKIIQRLLLRTMSRAVYSPRNVGHFGLASVCYTHFTSPIRRYPDLIVHRILSSALAGRTGGIYSSRGLNQIADHCSERERIAMKAEWACRDLAAAFFMKDKVGKEFSGVIAGVTEFGLFVELAPYAVEGLLSVRNLRDDHYIFRSKQHELMGRKRKKRFRIGDPLQVLVDKVNLEKRWIDLVLAK